jgi:hypothetical protein
MTKGSDLIHADKNTFGSQDLGGGLTKREYFAALALQGITSRLSTADVLEIRDGIRAGKHEALVAVSLADALVEVLNK